MLYFVLNLAFLLVLGLLGLMGTGGLPGGNKDANAAVENVAAKLAPFAGIIGVVARAEAGASNQRVTESINACSSKFPAQETTMLFGT